VNELRGQAQGTAPTELVNGRRKALPFGVYSYVSFWWRTDE
jgi:hypothetical protein